MVIDFFFSFYSSVFAPEERRCPTPSVCVRCTGSNHTLQRLDVL